MSTAVRQCPITALGFVTPSRPFTGCLLPGEVLCVYGFLPPARVLPGRKDPAIRCLRLAGRSIREQVRATARRVVVVLCDQLAARSRPSAKPRR
jgi:hypothetical protein